MALTINPAVSRVSYRRWTLHAALFILAAACGAIASYAVARALYVVITATSPAAWLVVALPLITLAALRDLGFQVPVPYPETRQVPEWVRRVVSPGWTAIAYGGQLGTGFLTRFTYSTHTAFVAILATQSSVVVVGAATLTFGLAKGIVVASSLGGRSYPEFEQRLLRRHRLRGQLVLRFANATLAILAATILTIDL